MNEVNFRVLNLSYGIEEIIFISKFSLFIRQLIHLLLILACITSFSSDYLNYEAEKT